MVSTGLRVPSLMLLSVWAAAGAVDANAAGADASEAAGNNALEEVVVTAQRREENVDRVPISIQAFTQNDLDQRSIKSIGDIASITPGVDFRPVGYENWITIRGISQNAGGGVAGLGPNTTAIYIDDAPIQARYGNAAVPTAIPMLFDIDHVEVLRGPQGTIFGASAEGGAIRLISHAPSLTEYSGIARAEESYIERGGINSEVGAAFGGPIIQDALGFRVSVWSRHDGGFVDKESRIFGGVDQDNTNKSDSFVGRAALLGKFGPVTAEASFYYQKRDQNSADLWDPTASNPSEGRFVSSRGLMEPIYDSFYTPSLKLTADFGWATLTSISTNLHRADSQGYDYTTVLPPAFGYPLPTSMTDAEATIVGTTQNNFTQEFRLQSPADQRLRWTVGVYYSNLHQHDFETVQAPNFPNLVFANTGQTVEQAFGEGLVGNGLIYTSDQYFGDKEKAVFANGEFDINSQFTLFGGARYEKQDSTYLTVSDGPLVGGPAVQAANSDSHILAPKGGVNWKLSENTLVYVSAAKGYRPGGVNIPVALTTPECVAQLAALGNTNSYAPDYLWSYELGVKSTLFDRRLAIEGSVYHIKWNDIISAIHVPACATHVATNLGDAKSDGFDLSVKAIVTPNITVGLYASYTDARYTTTTAIFGETVSRAGQAISDISPWNVTAEVMFQTPIKDGLDGYARLEDRYNSRNNKLVPAEDPTTNSYDPFVTTNPMVNQLNGRIGLRFAGADVAIFGDNLTNAHPVLNEYLGLIDITSGAFTIRPRTVGVSLLYHY